MSLGAALLILAAPISANSPAGLYETHQMEVAAALELKPNGHFRYALTYGAVDEEARGDWTFDGITVRLTSNPMPKPPESQLKEFGIAAFRNEPLNRVGTDLLLRRYDTTFRFMKVRP